MLFKYARVITPHIFNPVLWTVARAVKTATCKKLSTACRDECGLPQASDGWTPRLTHLLTLCLPHAALAPQPARSHGSLPNPWPTPPFRGSTRWSSHWVHQGERAPLACSGSLLKLARSSCQGVGSFPCCRCHRRRRSEEIHFSKWHVETAVRLPTCQRKFCGSISKYHFENEFRRE